MDSGRLYSVAKVRGNEVDLIDFDFHSKEEAIKAANVTFCDTLDEDEASFDDIIRFKIDK